MFFAWYDHDGKGVGHAAYEIAVKYKDGEWRIENKVFDTFQDIALSTLSPEDLAIECEVRCDCCGQAC